MSYFTGKTVLITGAASGIGRATALRFAEEGASVALLDRDNAGLLATVDALPPGSRSLLLNVDIQEEEAIATAVQSAVGWGPGLDAVINVAGISPAETFLESTRAYWDDLVETNLRGTYLVAREAARTMKAARRGVIVNVSSVLALVGDPSLVVYSATKGGISAMTRAMAVNLAPYGIRVNAVCPGDVATPLLDSWIEQQADPAATRAKMESSYPLGHYARPEDIAGVIIFLAGPDARCITGANIVVDCGLTVKCY